MAEIEWYQIEAAVQTNSPYRAQEPDELDHIRAAKNALIRYVSRLAGIVTSWQLRTCWQTHLALDDVMSNSQGMAMNAKPGAGRSVRLPKLCQMAAYRLPTVTLQASWSGSSSTAIAPYLARLFSTITHQPGVLFITGGLFDKTDWLKPCADLWTRSAQPWFTLPTDIPYYQTQPENLSGILELWPAWNNQSPFIAKSSANG